MNLRKALDKADPRGEGPPARLQRGFVSAKRQGVASAGVRRFLQQGAVDAKRLLQNRFVCIAPDADELESYKVLRTRIGAS